MVFIFKSPKHTTDSTHQVIRFPSTPYPVIILLAALVALLYPSCEPANYIDNKNEATTITLSY